MFSTFILRSNYRNFIVLAVYNLAVGTVCYQYFVHYFCGSLWRISVSHYVFTELQRVYVACARQIKRIDSIRRSPLYAFFSETLNGASSIRAYRQQDRFIARSDALLDYSQRIYFEVFTSNRYITFENYFLLVSQIPIHGNNY